MHAGAFGIEICDKNIDKVRNLCNNKIGKEDLVTVHEVDYEIKASNLKNSAISEVAEAYAIWGNQVDEPNFVITDVDVDAKDIKGYGEHNGFIKFKFNDVDFIKNYCSKGDIDELTQSDRNILGENKKKLKITIIGHFTFNMYEGNKYPQVKISSFYSEERLEKTEDELSFEDVF